MQSSSIGSPLKSKSSSSPGWRATSTVGASTVSSVGAGFGAGVGGRWAVSSQGSIVSLLSGLSVPATTCGMRRDATESTSMGELDFDEDKYRVAHTHLRSTDTPGRKLEADPTNKSTKAHKSHEPEDQVVNSGPPNESCQHRRGKTRKGKTFIDSRVSSSCMSSRGSCCGPLVSSSVVAVDGAPWFSAELRVMFFLPSLPAVCGSIPVSPDQSFLHMRRGGREAGIGHSWDGEQGMLLVAVFTSRRRQTC